MSAAVVRGPVGFLLQTQTGQWLVLGLGAASIFPEKCEELIRPVIRSLILGLPNVPSSRFIDKGSTSPPIVIQAGGSSSSITERMVGQLMTYTIGAGAVWVSYSVLVNYLPDWAKEMLPVTRHIFDKAVKNLGKGIVVVSEKISQLANRQEETHHELLEARQDIVGLRDSLDGIEDTLDDAGQVQSRTARGVKLLVRAVATLVPGNHSVAQDLIKYAKDLDIDTAQVLQEQGRVNTLMTPPQSHSKSSSNISYMGGKFITPQSMPRTPTTTALTSVSSEISEISEIPVEDQNQNFVNTVSGKNLRVSPSSVVFDANRTITSCNRILPSSTISMQSKLNALLGQGRLIS